MASRCSNRWAQASRGAIASGYRTVRHHVPAPRRWYEDHLNLLAGLANQADLVMFPVDCISHHAAQVAKQLCRQAGRRFIPLRSARAASLLAALQRPEAAGLTDAAD
jgi:hypothetical protein